MKAMRFVGRWWAFFALAAALALLGAAHAFEHFGGYAPCPLCLKQRDALWFAVVIAAPASAWAAISRSRGTPRVSHFLLFAVFLTGAVVAAFHAGGELKWWALPRTCGGAATGGVDMDAVRALWEGSTRTRFVACDVAAWSFLGVSMAGWNAVANAGLAVISFVASIRPRESRRAR